jgi:hypothetical protein
MTTAPTSSDLAERRADTEQQIAALRRMRARLSYLALAAEDGAAEDLAAVERRLAELANTAERLELAVEGALAHEEEAAAAAEAARLAALTAERTDLYRQRRAQYQAIEDATAQLAQATEAALAGNRQIAIVEQQLRFDQAAAAREHIQIGIVARWVGTTLAHAGLHGRGDFTYLPISQAPLPSSTVSVPGEPADDAAPPDPPDLEHAERIASR